jgi:putative transposase
MADFFADVLRSYMREWKFRVHDFVVMQNHVRLLITVDEAMSIEKAVQLIKGNFSHRARSEPGFRGEIWQRGFSDVRVRDEESFRKHQQNIYENPVKAGIARMADEYPHASLYLRQIKRGGLKPGSVGAAIGTTKVVPRLGPWLIRQLAASCPDSHFEDLSQTSVTNSLRRHRASD